jgi:DUF1009 family protein
VANFLGEVERMRTLIYNLRHEIAHKNARIHRLEQDKNNDNRFLKEMSDWLESVGGKFIATARNTKRKREGMEIEERVATGKKRKTGHSA